MLQFFCLPGICPTEQQCFVQISFRRRDQCTCDTVRDFFWITVFQAMETFLSILCEPCLIKVLKIARPGMPTGLFDNTDLFFFTVDVRLFIRQICVTLVCRDKACPHLYAIHAKCQSPIHIGTVIDPACQHDRYIFVAVRFDFSYHGQDFFTSCA